MLATAGFDVISDVHGDYDALVSLFHELGYVYDGNFFVHPKNRIPIFIGDGPDRGSQQLKTLNLMRRMVKSGRALMTLGNHELNIISLLTKSLDGSSLRDHTDPFVQGQHSAFFNEIAMGSQNHKDMVEWFKTIPLFLELEGLSCVHACWHQESIDVIKSYLGDNNNALGDEGMKYFIENEDFREAVYMTLMGPQYELPEGFAYVDAHGNPREIARNMWALPERNLGERLYLNGKELPPYIKAIIDGDTQGREYGVKNGVLCFGHYSQLGEPQAPTSQDYMLCLDFMKAQTAYRFNPGDTRISGEQLVSVQSTPQYVY